MAGYVDPDSWLARVFLEWIGSAIMGAAAVYIAVYVAPAHNRIVAVVMAGLILVVSGALLFAGFLARDYWAIFGTVCLNVGSIAMTYGVFHPEAMRSQ
jgi:hypothetical protein